MLFIHHSDPDSLAKAGLRISDVAGKGKALFAVRDLRANALVCAERAVLKDVSAGGKLDDRRLERTFRDLSASDQGAYMALHDCTCSGQGARKSVGGVFRTNAFGRNDPSESSLRRFVCMQNGDVCPVLSRANHSCIPNAFTVFHPDGDYFGLVTCRHVRAGEEICIAYIDSNVMTRASRQKDLQQTYKFSCSCPACCPLSDAAGIESDENRQAIGRLEAAFMKAPPGSPAEFVETVWQLHSLYRREGLMNPMINGRLHAKLVLPLLVLNATLEEIRESAVICATTDRLVHGQGSVYAKRFARYVERSRTEEALQAWHRELYIFHQVLRPMGFALVSMCSITILFGPFGWLGLASGAALLAFAGQKHFAVALAMCGWLPWPLSGVAALLSSFMWTFMEPLYSHFRN